MKLRRLFSLALGVLLLALSTGAAFAADYLGTGYFSTNQMYRCHLGTYTTENSAAYSKWATTTDLIGYTSCNSNNITTTGLDYGNTGWGGYAYICNVGGGCGNYNATYASCTARSNVYYLRTWTYTQRQYVATHELGHCWSLGHRSDSTSVMQSGQLSFIDPNATDISLVNSRY